MQFRAHKSFGVAVSIAKLRTPFSWRFVTRWCVGSGAVTASGVLQICDDEPVPRIGAGLHRTR